MKNKKEKTKTFKLNKKHTPDLKTFLFEMNKYYDSIKEELIESMDEDFSTKNKNENQRKRTAIHRQVKKNI